MGYALAEALSEMGAKVTLVSGPTALELENPKIEIIKIREAQEMYEAVARTYPHCQIAVFAAAVADYTPQKKSLTKIKKDTGKKEIALKSTKDIALEMGKLKKPDQINVGFALESNDEEANAKSKLKKKNLDFIVLNSLKDEGAGFAHDTNRITIIDRDNNLTKFELKSKKDVAHDVVNHILKHSQV